MKKIKSLKIFDFIGSHIHWSSYRLATHTVWIKWFGYSFICQGTSTRRQRSDFFRSSDQSDRSKIEAIPLSALPKDTTSELAGLLLFFFLFYLFCNFYFYFILFIYLFYFIFFYFVCHKMTPKRVAQEKRKSTL